MIGRDVVLHSRVEERGNLCMSGHRHEMVAET